jgi:hypothetical protein
MSNLSKTVAAKLKAEGLNLTTAAEKIGVSQVSLRGVITGKSVPNARSLAKYAAFLGLTEEEVKAAGAGAGKKGKAAKAGAEKKAGKAAKKAAKAGKKKGGRKAKAAKAAKAEDAPKAKRGGKPGRKARGAGKGGASQALATIQETLANAEAVLSDPLIRQVVNATTGQRKALSFFLSQF